MFILKKIVSGFFKSLVYKSFALFSGPIPAMVHDETESGKDTGVGWFSYRDTVQLQHYYR